MDLLVDIKIHAQNIVNIKTNNTILVFVKKKASLIRNTLLTDFLVCKN